MTLTLERHWIEVTEPATGRCLGGVDTADAIQIRRVIDQARHAQQRWRMLAGEARAEVLLRWRKSILEHGEQLASCLSQENGKPYHEALLHEVVSLAQALDYLASTAPALQREQVTTPRWFKHRVHGTGRRPRGVTAVLSPFNFPLLIPGADAAAALVMGCAVVLKPSPHCPLIAQQLVQLAHAAGIPSELFQVLHGGAEVGQALIASGVDQVVFTGSTANGRTVARECGQQLIACTLELGGNCPLIVLDDADLDRTAQAIAFGTFTNSGQSCLAVGRVLVPRRLAAALTDRLEPLVQAMRQGDPASRSVDLGALVTPTQVVRCRRHVEQATSRGARAIVGHLADLPQGNFFPPTLLVGCSTDAEAFLGETFGPVLPLVAYDDIDDVVARLNGSDQGLTAYVFGSDLQRARGIAEVLDYGQVIVDHVLSSYMCPEVPLAGLRGSGLGVVHGVDGLLAHTTPSVIGMPRMRLPDVLEFGWGDPKRALAVAEGYLTSSTAWSKALGWTMGWTNRRGSS